MISVTTSRYTMNINIVYSTCVTGVIPVWLLYLVHEHLLDHFIFLYLDPDPLFHILYFLSHDIDCNFLFLEKHRGAHGSLRKLPHRPGPCGRGGDEKKKHHKMKFQICTDYKQGVKNTKRLIKLVSHCIW